jgi:hypothetical protein
MKKIVVLFAVMLAVVASHAQRNQIFSDNIHTLQVIANDDWQAPPIITLGGDNKVEISFDDMTHEYHRYVYKVQHCGADWQPSAELFYTDFIDGFDNNPIDDYAESLNTTQLFTHYSITIPNDRMKLKLSGNYRLDVFPDESDADAEHPMLTAFFSVVEPLMGLSASVTSNTDVDFNGSHQQLSFKLTYNGLGVRDAIQQTHTVVLQNRRWDNAVIDPKPDYLTSSSLEYQHNRALIFDAGNEYRKFEMLNVHHTSLNVDRIQWFAPAYHASLIDDSPRKNYIYEEDRDGSFYIRNDDNLNNSTASDYVFVHFTLKMPEPLTGGKVYVNGDFANDNFLSTNLMNYNADDKAYEAAIFLKQGYYNYQYLFLPDNGGSAQTAPIEGNFFQTENEYIILAYYRAQGARYDQLVAYKQMHFAIDARQ